MFLEYNKSASGPQQQAAQNFQQIFWMGISSRNYRKSYKVSKGEFSKKERERKKLRVNLFTKQQKFQF